MIGRRVSKHLKGQGAFKFSGTVLSDLGSGLFRVQYDLGQDGYKVAKEEWLTVDELQDWLVTDHPQESNSEVEEVTHEPKWSNEFVSPVFLQHHPEQEMKWVPVNESPQYGGKLSPQSGKALKALNEFYGGLDNAWNAGWRWLLLPNNHMWYAPTHDSAEYDALVKKHARGGKNKGSIASPHLHHVLTMIAKIQ